MFNLKQALLEQKAVNKRKDKITSIREFPDCEKILVTIEDNLGKQLWFNKDGTYYEYSCTKEELELLRLHNTSEDDVNFVNQLSVAQRVMLEDVNVLKLLSDNNIDIIVYCIYCQTKLRVLKLTKGSGFLEVCPKCIKLKNVSKGDE